MRFDRFAAPRENQDIVGKQRPAPPDQLPGEGGLSSSTGGGNRDDSTPRLHRACVQRLVAVGDADIGKDSIQQHSLPVGPSGIPGGAAKPVASGIEAKAGSIAVGK